MRTGGGGGGGGGGLTASSTTAEVLAPNVISACKPPVKAASTECKPGGRVVGGKVATPLTVWTVAIGWPSIVKVTVPEGTLVPPGAVPVTVAVKVTELPKATGVAEVPTVTLVGAGD